MIRIISGVSEILFKRMLDRSYIEKIELDETGFTVFAKGGEKTPLYFNDVKAVRTGYYLDKTMPCCIVILFMNDHKKYSIDVSLKETDSILKHYAHYQLKGDVPENISKISVVLQVGVNGYSIRLEKGYLIETKRNHEYFYPLNEIESYGIDKRSDAIDIIFRNREAMITLSMSRVTNIWLVLQILGKLRLMNT